MEGNEALKQQLTGMIQLKYFYETITDVASQCFERCLPRLNDHLDSHERICIENCAGRFLDMKMFLTKRMIAMGKQEEK